MKYFVKVKIKNNIQITDINSDRLLTKEELKDKVVQKLNLNLTEVNYNIKSNSEKLLISDKIELEFS